MYIIPLWHNIFRIMKDLPLVKEVERTLADSHHLSVPCQIKREHWRHQERCSIHWNKFQNHFPQKYLNLCHRYSSNSKETWITREERKVLNKHMHINNPLNVILTNTRLMTKTLSFHYKRRMATSMNPTIISINTTRLPTITSHPIINKMPSLLKQLHTIIKDRSINKTNRP